MRKRTFQREKSSKGSAEALGAGQSLDCSRNCGCVGKKSEAGTVHRHARLCERCVCMCEHVWPHVEVIGYVCECVHVFDLPNGEELSFHTKSSEQRSSH